MPLVLSVVYCEVTTLSLKKNGLVSFGLKLSQDNRQVDS